MRARLAAAISISVLAVLAVAPAQADALGDFYSDHPINFIVGSGPGGSHDIYARLLARHLGTFLPGNPRINVQNMPGAGSLRAAS
jgi:tripartite-type tricarboxylate transporter receptor subunit TctC